MDYDVIVIGAGAGGLSAGASIAAGGLKTLVLEQADFVGGCASSFDRDGFRFDTGACIIEMARAHDWFYERLGLQREDYIKFIPTDPAFEMIDPLSGNRYLVPSSIEGVAEMIRQHSAEDAQAFTDFIRGPGRMLDELVDVVFTTPQGRLRHLAKVFTRFPRLITNARYLLTPYGKLVNDLFRHPFTRSFLSYYSAIGGLPPSIQSAVMLWGYYGERDGMFYPKGGMGELTRAMAKALIDVGGELQVGTSVQRLHLEKGKARGVVLEDGTIIRSRAVVSNVNARTLYLNMVGEEHIPGAIVKGLESYEFSPACAVAYLGLDYKPPMKAQHMIAMTSPELMDKFWSGFVNKNVAVPQGVGLVSSSTRENATPAPAGCPPGSTWCLRQGAPIRRSAAPRRWRRRPRRACPRAASG